MAISAIQQRELSLFANDLKKFSKTVGVNLEKTVKKISFDLHRKIVQKTPVDTGRARGSWNISAGAPDKSVRPARGGKASKGAATQEALKRQLTFDMRDPYSKVYITNNLPYIKVLEEGNSKQAPRGMVRVSIVEIESDITRVIKEATRS